MIPMLIYLVTVNALAFLLMLSDKHRAIKKSFRIPEVVLIGCALVGGSIGSLIGMFMFRHKIRHSRFRNGLPLIFALHVFLAFLMYVSYSF